MVRTSVFYEHNRVLSPVTVTEEGLFHAGQVPEDVEGGQLDVDIVHEVQLSDREGNLVVLHFDVPKAKDSGKALADYTNKSRKFSDTGDNTMPSGLYTTTIKKNADNVRAVLQLPNTAE